MNTGKTHIVYCKDDARKDSYPNEKFTFLGYTFRPRRSKNRWGKLFINFTPAVSGEVGVKTRLGQFEEDMQESLPNLDHAGRREKEPL